MNRVALLCVVVVALFSTSASAGTYSMLYALGSNAAAGSAPHGGLEVDGSTIYVATSGGGSAAGTLFKLNSDGTGFQLLRSFTGIGGQGTSPLAGVIKVGSTLFGTTSLGGASGAGTIYSVSTDGTGFQQWHSFARNAADGQLPATKLVLDGTALYGTTSGGPPSGGDPSYPGTLFGLNTDGSNYHVIRAFSGGVVAPQAPTVSGSTIYGTTVFNGLYKVNSDNTDFQTLHLFGGAGDGSGPYGQLVQVGSTLYGATQSGGSAFIGTIFSIQSDGSNYQVLHEFAGADGQNPYSGLTLLGSKLYGTTYSGGTSNRGTLFSLNLDGTGFQVVHSFAGFLDGANPDGPLTAYSETIYGTTTAGGLGAKGVIFSFAVPEPSSWLLAASALLAGCLFRRRS